MNLRHLEYFRVLADLEHYTQAAGRLCITQPSLSHAIAELEKELEVPLFEKQGRNVRLTKFGKHFLQYASNALDELDRGEKKIRQLACPSKGVVELAFIYTLGARFVPRVVQAFASHEQNKEVQLLFYQGSTTDIIHQLKDERCDLAFCSKVDGEPDIEFVPIAKQELVVIVHPSHPLAAYDRVDLKSTAGYPFICFNRGSGVRPVIDQLFEQSGVTPNIICEVEEDTAMAGLVSINYGIAVMPCISSLAQFPVKAVKIASPSYERFIYLASVKNRYLAPASARFRDFAITYGQDHFLATHTTV
ncbi:LysR family transcriptional regulator [Paenibacillus silvae]|uniref:LysR family transcriptional regulator n=1 Tax=Paenibacillus silvae TaxID=1325358 RepID=A0A2W6NLC6_9BACL|nr:LysR family transcriptional regulator [Paenibacillus silvae]PZT56589.1 LysR family transcriptional regulator [Paenibacillus silvae]